MKVRDLRVRRLFQEREFLVTWKAPDSVESNTTILKYCVYRSFQYFGGFQKVGEVGHSEYSTNYSFVDVIPYLWGMTPYYKVTIYYKQAVDSDTRFLETSLTDVDPVTTEYFSGAQVFPYSDTVIAKSFIVDDVPPETPGKDAPVLLDGCESAEGWFELNAELGEEGSYRVVTTDAYDGKGAFRINYEKVGVFGYGIKKSLSSSQDWSTFSRVGVWVKGGGIPFLVRLLINDNFRSSPVTISGTNWQKIFFDFSSYNGRSSVSSFGFQFTRDAFDSYSCNIDDIYLVTPNGTETLLDNCESLTDWSEAEFADDGKFDLDNQEKRNGDFSIKVTYTRAEPTFFYTIAKVIANEDWTYYDKLTLWVKGSPTTKFCIQAVVKRPDNTAEALGYVTVDKTEWTRYELSLSNISRSSVTELQLRFSKRSVTYSCLLDYIELVGPRRVFSTTYPYHAGTLLVFVNNIKCERGVQFFEKTQQTFEFTAPPRSDDKIRVSYIRML